MNKHPIEDDDSTFNEGTLTFAFPDFNHHECADFYRALCLPSTDGSPQATALIEAFKKLAMCTNMVINKLDDLQEVKTFIMPFSTDDYRHIQARLPEDAIYPLMAEIEQALIDWRNQHVLREDTGLNVLSMLEYKDDKGVVLSRYFILEVHKDIKLHSDAMNFFAMRGNAAKSFNMQIEEYLDQAIRVMWSLGTPGGLMIPIHSHTANFLHALFQGMEAFNAKTAPYKHIHAEIHHPEYGLPIVPVTISFATPR